MKKGRLFKTEIVLFSRNAGRFADCISKQLVNEMYNKLPMEHAVPPTKGLIIYDMLSYMFAV